MHKPSQQAPTFRGRYKGLCRYRLFLATYRLGHPVNPVIVAHPSPSKSVQIEAATKAKPAAAEGSINEAPTADISKLSTADLTTLVRTHDQPHPASTETATAATTPATTATHRNAHAC